MEALQLKLAADVLPFVPRFAKAEKISQGAPFKLRLSGDIDSNSAASNKQREFLFCNQQILSKRPLVVNPLPGDFKVRHFRKPGYFTATIFMTTLCPNGLAGKK